MSQSLPPGAFGAPVIGKTIPIFRDPYAFAKEGFERYGPIFKTSFAGTKTAVMLGAEAQRYVLVANQRNFLSSIGYRFVQSFYHDSLLLTDDAEHDALRRLITPAFHMRALAAYLDQMNAIIARRLSSWGSGGQFTLLDELQAIAFPLATTILLGMEATGARYQRMLHLWETLSVGAGEPVRVDLPFTRYGQALRAKAQIDTLVHQIIVEQRDSDQPTVLRLLLDATDEDGHHLSDDQIVNQIRLLIFAGYDTSTGTLMWMIYELMRHPAILARLQAEIGANEPDRPVTMEDLRRKSLFDAVIDETLRLHPQTVFMFRGAKTSFAFGDYHVPAGWSVLLLPIFTQRIATYFAEPERFDPDRFLAPREEQKKTPYAWIGFGSGMHACIGEGIARMEMKTFLIRLLRRYTVAVLPDQDLSPLFAPLNRPKSGVLIHATARA